MYTINVKYILKVKSNTLFILQSNKKRTVALDRTKAITSAEKYWEHFKNKEKIKQSEMGTLQMTSKTWTKTIRIL